MNNAIFLDRDGVLIDDIHLLTNVYDIQIRDGVPQALKSLRDGGFQLIVVSNQTVVSRGLATEQDVHSMNAAIDQLLEQSGAPRIECYFFCPHHPNATLPGYRINCNCRKPRPGLLFRAAQEYQINLSESYMVGDRITDIIAGASAGCSTILVQTGKHQAPSIETVEPLDELVQPDYTCADLLEAAKWIMTHPRSSGCREEQE